MQDMYDERDGFPSRYTEQERVAMKDTADFLAMGRAMAMG